MWLGCSLVGKDQQSPIYVGVIVAWFEHPNRANMLIFATGDLYHGITGRKKESMHSLIDRVIEAGNSELVLNFVIWGGWIQSFMSGDWAHVLWSFEGPSQSVGGLLEGSKQRKTVRLLRRVWEDWGAGAALQYSAWLRR